MSVPEGVVLRPAVAGDELVGFAATGPGRADERPAPQALMDAVLPDGGRHHYAGLDAWEIRLVRP